MTNQAQFDELEPLDDGGAQAAPGHPQMPSMQELMLQANRAGLPAPAHNPRADKIYFRFLLAGLVMLIGCFQPFGPQYDLVGYKTPSGGLFLIIALGVCWAAWGAIHANRLDPKRMKWILFAFIPLLVELMNLLNCGNEPAVKAFALANPGKIPTDVASVFETLWSSLPLVGDARIEGGERIDNFLHNFGIGKLYVLFGALLAELFFIGSIFGAAKMLKQQKSAAMAARRSSPA
jgi:hypothetical protein